MKAKDVLNGTFGEVWLDSEKLSECFGLQAKIDLNKEEVLICGKLGKSEKVVGWEGKGSVKLNKVNTRMAIKLSNMIKKGIEVRCTIVSKLADPASVGAERVAIKGVLFDDLTIADWEAKKNGTVDAPFTFDNYQFVDMITPG